MFELDIRKLNAQRKYEGDLAFEFPADDGLLDIPYVGFSSPITARLRYWIAEDDKVEITGSVSFSLKGACSRCLKDVERRFEGEVEALFVPDAKDGEDYRYSGGIVDLNECLRDAVMFALPPRLECEEECVPLEWNE